VDSEFSEWIAGLSDPDPQVRRTAAENLSLAGEEARAAAVPLVRAAADDDEIVQEAATAALEEMGPPDPAEVAELASLLEDESADTAYWAATLLGRLGSEAAPAVDRLAAALEGSRPLNVRQRAAWALGKIGPGAASAQPALQAAAAAADPRLSRLSAAALENIAS